MTNIYNRRLGLEWDENLYNNLIKYLVDKKINSVQSLLMYSEITEISKYVFPKYGARKRYVDKIKDFIDCYNEIIIKDVIGKVYFHTKFEIINLVKINFCIL